MPLKHILHGVFVTSFVPFQGRQEMYNITDIGFEIDAFFARMVLTSGFPCLSVCLSVCSPTSLLPPNHQRGLFSHT